MFINWVRKLTGEQSAELMGNFAKREWCNYLIGYDEGNKMVTLQFPANHTEESFKKLLHAYMPKTYPRVLNLPEGVEVLFCPKCNRAFSADINKTWVCAKCQGALMFFPKYVAG